jgi:hypothetical protein
MNKELVAQRVYALALGSKGLNDHDPLGRSPTSGDPSASPAQEEGHDLEVANSSGDRLRVRDDALRLAAKAEHLEKGANPRCILSAHLGILIPVLLHAKGFSFCGSGTLPPQRARRPCYFAPALPRA